jgi:polysaccharide deacetylase 2 family uncharacterized protein YibQ
LAISPKNKDALEGLKALLQKKTKVTDQTQSDGISAPKALVTPLSLKTQIAKGLLAYAVFMLFVMGGLSLFGDKTSSHIEAQIPKAESFVRTITKLENSEKSSVMADFTRPHQTKTPEDASAPSLTAPLATFDPNDKRAKIALIVTNMGLKTALTEEAISTLPAAVTFAFSPYSSSLASSLKKATEDQHQSLLMLPLEPDDFPRNDPGPLALLLKYSPEENVHKLNDILQTAKPIVGTIPHMGSAFLKNSIAVETILSALDEEGLLFINTEGVNISHSDNLIKSYLQSDLSLDNILTPINIDENLNKLSTLALERGYAVAHIGLTPLALKILPNWIKKMEEENKITFVPITLMPEIMRRRNVQ